MLVDIGYLKLIDYEVPVGNTGIIFVATLSGGMTPDGVALLEPIQIEWAYHRAASQLAFMGLINGDTFAFLRSSIPMTVADVATLVGYPIGDVQDWEAGVEPVPVPAWQIVADKCCQIDYRPWVTQIPVAPDFRPRRIRIHPDIPSVVTTMPSSGSGSNYPC